MTAQIAEKLHYRGEDLQLCCEPLEQYFELARIRPPFVANCTALWRGYVGTWEITGERLYLMGLSGTLQDGSEANLEALFPGYPERVFAHWYCGTLRIPQGKMLEYVHAGYGSQFEHDLLITVVNGVVTQTEVRQNGISVDPHARVGYGPGAMLVFPNESPESDREEQA